MELEDLRRDARAIFDAALGAACPQRAVHRRLRLEGEELLVDGRPCPFRDARVVGFGKAGWPMARAVEEILGDRISRGVVVVKYGHGGPTDRVGILEAGHPIPDAAGEAGARAVRECLAGMTEGDLALVLVSGGGSALLADPAEGLTLADICRVSEELLACGAPIAAMNAVRKHLSSLKGGGLARAIAPARTIALLLSDVIGDDPSTISSGPTAPDPTTFADALQVLRSYGLTRRVPEGALRRIERGVDGLVPETPKPGDPLFDRVANIVIGSNRMSIARARQEAEALGYRVETIGLDLSGEAREVGRRIALEAAALSSREPACLLGGGETTVTMGSRKDIDGSTGRGGRNQELALAAAIALEGMSGVVLLSAGTDGTDGPTDAAGAIVDGGTLARARARGFDPEDSLARHDSYPLLDAAGDLVKTGPTLTNVMDIHVTLRAPTARPARSIP